MMINKTLIKVFKWTRKKIKRKTFTETEAILSNQHPSNFSAFVCYMCCRIICNFHCDEKGRLVIVSVDAVKSVNLLPFRSMFSTCTAFLKNRCRYSACSIRFSLCNYLSFTLLFISREEGTEVLIVLGGI